MKIQVLKVNGGLYPADNSDYEVFKRMPNDKQFEIDYTKGRNSKFHRKFWALMKLAFDNQECYIVLNDLREKVEIVAGYYREVTDFQTGEIERKPLSIAYNNMGELEFNKLYEDCKAVIINWLKIDNEQIAEEIERFF